MRKTTLALASTLALILCTTPAHAQAAAEAGMLTGAVSGLTSATSHKLDVSKVGGKVTQVTNTSTQHRTATRHAKTTTAKKKIIPTTTAANHPANQQGHIVSVWPKDALKQTPPQ